MTKISPNRLQAGIGFNDEIRAGERFGLYRQRVGQARHISDQGEDGVAHPYNVADGVTDAGKLHSNVTLAGFVAVMVARTCRQAGLALGSLLLPFSHLAAVGGAS